MIEPANGSSDELTGDHLLATFNALANPLRMRILGALHGERRYVSQLARDMQMGRPLLHMHLRKLEAARLITGSIEVSEDGKAMKFYEVADFDIELTPELIARAVATLGQAAQERDGE